MPHPRTCRGPTFVDRKAAENGPVESFIVREQPRSRPPIHGGTIDIRRFLGNDGPRQLAVISRFDDGHATDVDYLDYH